MQKNIGIAITIVAILVLGFLWMSRSRPTDELPQELSEATDGAPLRIRGANPKGTPDVGTESPVVSLDEPLVASASPVASSVFDRASDMSAAVSISASGFAPASTAVSAGGTVTFTNSDTVSHQVSSAPHPVHTSYPPLNGSVLTSGASFAVTFSQVGTYLYHDHLNPGLIGKVIVE